MRPPDAKDTAPRTAQDSAAFLEDRFPVECAESGDRLWFPDRTQAWPAAPSATRQRAVPPKRTRASSPFPLPRSLRAPRPDYPKLRFPKPDSSEPDCSEML